MVDELTPAPIGEPDPSASGDAPDAPGAVEQPEPPGITPTRGLSDRRLLVLRVAIVLAILVALLAAGGGVDGAQHTFAHMFPSDVNACGGG